MICCYEQQSPTILVQGCGSHAFSPVMRTQLESGFIARDNSMQFLFPLSLFTGAHQSHKLMLSGDMTSMLRKPLECKRSHRSEPILQKQKSNKTTILAFRCSRSVFAWCFFTHCISYIMMYHLFPIYSTYNRLPLKLH